MLLILYIFYREIEKFHPLLYIGKGMVSVLFIRNPGLRMFRILIFDSGVGGLSISQNLSDHIPDAEQILLADNAWFPYGELEETALLKRVEELLSRAVKKLQPDCIVIACNTASTIALQNIRSILPIPVIGVVPAIKPAAETSSSKIIGLLATPATVKRSYTAELISEFADDCNLISVGSTRLVEIAEQYLRGQKIDEDEIVSILQPFIVAGREQGMDRLVLGCTHFPLLSKVLERLLPKTVRLVDSSDAIARQVRTVLPMSELQTSPKTPDKICYLTLETGCRELGAGLHKLGFSSPEMLQV